LIPRRLGPAVTVPPGGVHSTVKLSSRLSGKGPSVWKSAGAEDNRLYELSPKPMGWSSYGPSVETGVRVFRTPPAESAARYINPGSLATRRSFEESLGLRPF
ncbi:MAG: hypothetical protein QOJ73_6488, partial [Streptosporangiaceae bacterium]|nr:hypothetical protein [Streptosporangiaceae bacterium]